MNNTFKITMPMDSTSITCHSLNTNRRFLVLVCLLTSLVHVVQTSFADTEDICHLSSCQPKNLQAQEDNFCHQVANHSYVRGRCCIVNSTVVGIDLRNCSLQNLNILQSNQTGQVQILLLTDNPIKNCSVEQFQGLKKLETLTVPSTCGCPGVTGSWDHVEERAGQAQCDGQVDWCTSDRNFTCPKNSHCEMDGPGFVQCLCDDGYYGYKCLKRLMELPPLRSVTINTSGSEIRISDLATLHMSRIMYRGEFQYVTYFTSIAGGTVGFSLFFWVTHRRYVSKH